MLLFLFFSVRQLQQLYKHVRWKWPVCDSLYPESATGTRRRAHQRDPGCYQLGLGRSLPSRARLPVALEEEQTEEAAAGRRGRSRGEAEVARGFDHVPVGILAQAATRPRVLSTLYQMDESRAGRLQAGRQQGGLAALGHTQEQTGHELRNDGQGTALLLSARHSGEGGWSAAGLPIR